MTAWWQSLTTLEHALLYIAIPATLILVIQTILLFVGGGLGGEDCGDSPDTDLGRRFGRRRRSGRRYRHRRGKRLL